MHQSGREWNDKFDNILKSLGFDEISWCNCVYSFNNDAILLVYVDDLILFARNEVLIRKITKLIKSKVDIQELGEVKYILGVNFERGKNEYYMHQRTYIEKLMIKFKELPKSNVSLSLKIGSLPPKEETGELIETNLMKKFPYRSLIGCLVFLANRSRPDMYIFLSKLNVTVL